MNDFLKTLKVAWFGIKNSKVLFMLMLILCCILVPALIYLSMNEDFVSISYYEMRAVGTLTAYICGIFAPAFLFSYLHNRTEQDFYSSMPVKRPQYFFGYFISGMLIFLVPYTLMFVICGFLPNTGLWAGYLKPVGMYFVLYCSLTLCMLLCTSKAGAAVTYVLRNGLPASLVVLPFILANLDSSAYFELLSDKILMLTPIGTGFCLMEDYEHILSVQLIIAAAELALSYFLYIKRRNETSLALAFPKARYLYQYAVMTVAALYITAIFVLMFGITSRYNEDKWIYVIFFTAAFSFGVFVILNVILEKNSKAAFHKIRHLFIFFGGFGIITLFVVNALMLSLPQSVLPFAPKFAVVSVYTVEEVDKNERWEFSSYVHHEDSPKNEEAEHIYCHVKPYKTFIVTDNEKLKALNELAQKPIDYFDSYSNLSLLRSHSSWGYMNLYFQEEVPSDLIAVKIDFYNANISFKDEITQEALDELIGRSDLQGTYRQSTRYGFGREEKYILSFADVNVK